MGPTFKTRNALRAEKRTRARCCNIRPGCGTGTFSRKPPFGPGLGDEERRNGTQGGLRKAGKRSLDNQSLPMTWPPSPDPAHPAANTARLVATVIDRGGCRPRMAVFDARTSRSAEYAASVPRSSRGCRLTSVTAQLFCRQGVTRWARKPNAKRFEIGWISAAAALFQSGRWSRQIGAIAVFSCFGTLGPAGHRGRCGSSFRRCRSAAGSGGSAYPI